MKTSTEIVSSSRSLKIKSTVKAGGLKQNHSATRTASKPTKGPKIATGIKAGQIEPNHSATRLVVRSGIKAGGLKANHSASQVRAR